MSEISSKELKVIESLSRNRSASQRDISDDIGVSLGLTNILINRLMKKGYLKASRLNARKIRYIVTPKGLKEKAGKSYRFMARSFSVMKQLKDYLGSEIKSFYDSGARSFLLLGSGELTEIAELIIKAMKYSDIELSALKEPGNPDLTYEAGAVLINTGLAGRENGVKADIDLFGKAEELYGSNYEL